MSCFNSVDMQVLRFSVDTSATRLVANIKYTKTKRAGVTLFL